MNLQYGDLIKLPDNTKQLNKVVDVKPVKFDTVNESWLVCAQNNATHMLVVTEESLQYDKGELKYMLIEIGKCEQLYLLADAIVD